MYLLFMATRKDHYDAGSDMFFVKKTTLTEAKECAKEGFAERHPYGKPYQFARITSNSDDTDIMKYRGGEWHRTPHELFEQVRN